MGSYTQVEGDSSPETPTRVYTVQELQCLNPQCPEYKQAQETRTLVYEGVKEG